MADPQESTSPEAALDVAAVDDEGLDETMLDDVSGGAVTTPCVIMAPKNSAQQVPSSTTARFCRR